MKLFFKMFLFIPDSFLRNSFSVFVNILSLWFFLFFFGLRSPAVG